MSAGLLSAELSEVDQTPLISLIYWNTKIFWVFIGVHFRSCYINDHFDTLLQVAKITVILGNSYGPSSYAMVQYMHCIIFLMRMEFFLH